MNTPALRLVLPPDAAPSSPSFAGRWIDLDEAARRSGLTDRRLRQLCGERWLAQGLARMERPADGGKARWIVREDADPSLASVKFVEQLNAEWDMRELTDDQRAVVVFRERVVTEAEKVMAGAVAGGQDKRIALEQYCQHLESRGTYVSPASVYNWTSDYRTAGRRGLVDKRWRVRNPDGSDNAGDATFAEFYAELQRWYEDGNHPSAQVCYRLASAVARKSGWPIPSPRSARRHLQKIDLPRRTLHRQGREAFDNKVGAYIARDYTRIVVDGEERDMESNDIWCGDQHPCDVLCWRPNPGTPANAPRTAETGKFFRPWLTAWQDARSRRIVGYHYTAGDPDSTDVLLAFRKAVIGADCGVPMSVYVDNGKVYDCYMLQGMTKWERRRVKIELDGERFKGVFGTVGVRVLHAAPYNAKAKPVERFFRTYEEQFGVLQRTYTAGSPQHKPAHLEDRLRRGEAPTFEEYVAAASAWIDECHHATEGHTGQGMDGKTPDVVYAENLRTVRTTTLDALEICLQETSRPVTVGRNGISYKKRLYGQGDPALTPFAGRKVHVRVDPDDITRVTVWTPRGQKLCTVAANDLVPFGTVSNAKWKAAVSTVTKHNRAMREAAKHGMRKALDPVEVLLEGARAERLADPEPPKPSPDSVRMVRTGLEGASKGRQTALRPAVGAESTIDLLAAAEDFDFDQPRRRANPSATNDLLDLLNRQER